MPCELKVCELKVFPAFDVFGFTPARAQTGALSSCAKLGSWVSAAALVVKTPVNTASGSSDTCSNNHTLHHARPNTANRRQHVGAGDVENDRKLLGDVSSSRTTKLPPRVTRSTLARHEPHFYFNPAVKPTTLAQNVCNSRPRRAPSLLK